MHLPRRWILHLIQSASGRGYRGGKEDRLSHQKKMAAIFETLRSSIETDLNASLTPDDCRELLRMFAMIRMQATIQSTPAPAAPRGQTPVEKIVSGVADLAHKVIEDIAGDIKGAGVPARKRRK